MDDLLLQECLSVAEYSVSSAGTQCGANSKQQVQASSVEPHSCAKLRAAQHPAKQSAAG